MKTIMCRYWTAWAKNYLVNKNVIFYQSYVRVHTCTDSIAKIVELLPSYSSDLIPCDYFFITQNNENNGSPEKFTSNLEIIPNETHILMTFQKLTFCTVYSEKYCIELRVVYVEQ